MWVEFVVGSLGAVFFSNHSGFFHPKRKVKISKSILAPIYFVYIFG